MFPCLFPKCDAGIEMGFSRNGAGKPLNCTKIHCCVHENQRNQTVNQLAPVRLFFGDDKDWHSDNGSVTDEFIVIKHRSDERFCFTADLRIKRRKTTDIGKIRDFCL